MFISRDLSSELLDAASHYPVVTITGPRQSGKTTLVKQTFPNKPYVSLEELDIIPNSENKFTNCMPKFVWLNVISSIM